MQYPPIVKRYVMEPKLFQGYLEWGIARSLSILLYEPKYNMHLNWTKAPYCFDYPLGLQYPPK
jgi:hypothetical protein